MDSSEAATRRAVLLITSLVLMLVGWIGVLIVINLTLPTVAPRWSFFLVWFIALTGTAMPFANFLYRRFAGNVPSELVVLREAIFFGLFGATCAWLQLGRALNWATGLLLAVGLLAIEIFLILRVRSQWKPNDPAPTPERRDPTSSLH